MSPPRDVGLGWLKRDGGTRGEDNQHVGLKISFCAVLVILGPKNDPSAEQWGPTMDLRPPQAAHGSPRSLWCQWDQTTTQRPPQKGWSSLCPCHGPSMSPGGHQEVQPHGGGITLLLGTSMCGAFMVPGGTWGWASPLLSSSLAPGSQMERWNSQLMSPLGGPKCFLSPLGPIWR